MVKYNYNAEMEAFKRADNRGKAIYVNVAEAQRIVSMLELGYSVADICGKVSLNSPKGSLTTIKSFIRNYKNGNIEIPTDAPAPSNVYESMDYDVRFEELENKVLALEERIDKLENPIRYVAESIEHSCGCECKNESMIDKVKSWIR